MLHVDIRVRSGCYSGIYQASESFHWCRSQIRSQMLKADTIWSQLCASIYCANDVNAHLMDKDGWCIQCPLHTWVHRIELRHMSCDISVITQRFLLWFSRNLSALLCKFLFQIQLHLLQDYLLENIQLSLFDAVVGLCSLFLWMVVVQFFCFLFDL